MVRSEISLVDEHQFDHHGPVEMPRDQVLPAMCVASVGLLLLRAASMAYASITEEDEGEVETAKPIPKGLPFFVGAIVNVLMKLGSAAAHGLLAINWVLAGAEPGMQLVACFVLVAINTHMLSSVALVVHLRSLLASVAITYQTRIRFDGVTHLWGAPAGVACLALNGISTSILLAHLYEKPQRTITWLATAGGFLMWANSNFKSVGLMDAATWKEITESESEPDSALSISEFLRNLGILKSLPDSDGQIPPFWLRILRFSFNQDDELLLRHRRALLRRAYPQAPRARWAHGAGVLYLGLLSTAVPMILVAYCWSRIPRLSDVELVGGTYFPSLSPSRQDYYIAMEDSGSNGINMVFQMELGEASRYRFCCEDAGCSKIDVHDKSSILHLKSFILPEQFGTCHLHLSGLRSNEYTFTVLSLRHMSITLNALADAPFVPYRAKVHSYSSDVVKPDGVDELVLTSKLQMDSTQIRPSFVALGGKQQPQEPLEKQKVDSNKSITIRSNISQMLGALNVSLNITLLPQDESVEVPSMVTSNTYQVSVHVFTIEERLKNLLGEISELRARIDANQETAAEGELVENLQKLKKTTHYRNELLRRAYRNQQPNAIYVNTPQRLTFLTIGVTGTGKSELCRWMTASDECSSSDSMESHTGDVHRINAHAFGDTRFQPLIEWIDTPGRGDTRGASYDEKLWSQTMSKLLERGQSGARIDRIVWVVNAAWQRATEVRNRMLQELRMSFGVDLYKNLVIMLNFLPHSANRTEYEEVKQRQKEKFVN